MGSHIFGFFGVRQFFIFTVSKRTRMFFAQMKSKAGSSFNLENESIHKNIESGKVGIGNMTYLPKSDYDGVYNWPQNRL